MSTNEAAEQLRYNLAGEIDADSNLNLLDAALTAERNTGAAPLDVERLRAEIAEEMAGPDNPDDLFEQGCLAAYNWVLARLSEGTDR